MTCKRNEQKQKKKEKEKKKQQLQRNKKEKKKEEDLHWSCVEEGRKKKERERKERKDESGVGGKVGIGVGGNVGKKRNKKFLVLHIAAFFEKRSYRSPLKNCSAEPIAAFFKNTATANL